MSEFGWTQREARVGGGRSHIWVRRGQWRGEGGLELVGVVNIARLLVWVIARMLRVAADAHGHLVNYSAPLAVGEAVAVLK